MYKEGYIIQVQTSENDGDNCQTRLWENLDKSDVPFFLDLLQYFTSASNAPKNELKFGNSGLGAYYSDRSKPYTQFLHAMTALRNLYPVAFDKFFSYGDEIVWDDEIHNIIENDDISKEQYYEIDEYCLNFHYNMTMLLGDTTEYDDYNLFFRVVDRVQVFYVPQDIVELDIDF